MKLAGLQVKGESSISGTERGNKLDGKTVVISGVFQMHSRDQYKELIEQQGGKNVSSVSAATSFILAGENMGHSKKEKAVFLGIQMRSEAEFLRLLNEE